MSTVPPDPPKPDEPGEGDYPLTPPDPTIAKPALPPMEDTSYLSGPPREPELPVQFSLRGVFLVVTLTAVSFSLARWMAGENLLGEAAGWLGIGLLAAAIVGLMFQPRRELYYLWWALFAIYLVVSGSAIISTLMPKKL
jgi:hypothetical protein